jgi:hypothetical protein
VARLCDHKHIYNSLALLGVECVDVRRVSKEPRAVAGSATGQIVIITANSGTEELDLWNAPWALTTRGSLLELFLYRVDCSKLFNATHQQECFLAHGGTCTPDSRACYLGPYLHQCEAKSSQV